MGILDKCAPETAQMAVVIASTMATMCHKCEQSEKTKILFGKILYQPNVDSDTCKACLEVQRKKTFGGDNGNNG